MTVLSETEELVERVAGIGGIILGVSENRSWIELLYEGDLMHPKTISFPPGTLLDVFVEEIPHKTTIYEYPRTLIYFAGPCAVEIVRSGSKLIVRGVAGAG
ncbi:MAG TPA: hypothetical protein VNL14_19450 [Candidatus Acidoferrales bacterium]|nr:hypothetical protein [Candidatus Acidoferrales bacterium]